MSPDPNAASTDTGMKNPGNARAAVAFGGSLLVVLLLLCVFLPSPSPSQCAIIRFLMALDAAFLSYFFFGNIKLDGKLAGYAVKATGGFVFFVLIQFVFDPFGIQTAVADTVPSIIPPSEEVQDIQEKLTETEEFSGVANGRLTSKTRDVIRKIQRENNIRPTGRLDDQTKRAIMSRTPPR